MKFDLTGRTPLAAAGIALLFTILATEPTAAHAQSGVTSKPTATNQSDVKDYWTPKRLLNAQPLELHPQVGSDGIPIAPEGAEQTTPPVSSPGAAPAVPASRRTGETLISPEMLTKPQSQNDELQLDSGEVPESSSGFGAFFT